MSSDYTSIYDILWTNVEEILGKKVSDEQFGDLSQSLFLIIKKQRNYLLNQFDIANQSIYFPNQQNINYPYTFNFFSQPNSLNNGSIFSAYSSNYTNGFIPSNNYTSMEQMPTPFPTTPLIQFPIISILPPRSLPKESPVHKTKKKKEKEEKTAKSSSKNAKKESKSNKDKKKVKKTPKRAKKSKKGLKPTFTEELKDTDDIFSSYIIKILRIVHPPLEISDSGTKHLNSLLIKIYKKLAAEASKIARSEDKNELDQQSIENAVQTFLPVKLAKYSINEGQKSIVNINKSDNAGLVFNIDVIYRLLCNAKYANSVRKDAAIYLAAVMDYLTIEILEVSGNMTEARETENIEPDFINTAINNDMELRELRSKLND